MSISSDRRASGVNRVAVDKTVVEICGRDAQVPAFEADAVELSGRGMHVRTEYLPELNAPLVLRFEDRGREVVVEGEVAWRREGEESAEFGIKFTALDSRSVEVLRDLCSTDSTDSTDAAKPEPAKAVVVEQPPGGVPGSPVKLHIEGLNAPMKARVRDTVGRRVHVGSNLEFLKVGRSIEVEDVDQGERRDAKIDSVTVAIDPQTQVPQLVVALRYAGEVTPQPSVVDTAPEEEAVAADASEDDVAAASEHDRSSEDDEFSEPSLQGEAEDEIDEHAHHAHEHPGERLKEQMMDTAARMGEMARQGGAAMGAFSVTAAKGFGRFAQGLGEQIASLRARSAAAGPKRRTAGAPSSMNAEGRRIRLQPQHRASGSAGQGNARLDSKGSGTTGKARPGRLAAGAVVLIVGTVGATLALSRSGSSSDHAGDANEQRAAAAAMPVQPSQQMPMQSAQPGQHPGQLQAMPPTQMQQGNPQPATALDQAGIVADVPLFGPTTLATAQPEPLASAPATVVAYEDQAPDQTFDDAPAEDQSAKSSAVKPEDVKPWANGKLHLPTVHRLRLDAPGAALKGFGKGNGFAVVIPDRKVTDNPKTIAKRDDRIKAVTADTSPEGAVITFKFRGPVPSHKVRLRNDYVEFFISAPGG